MTYTLDNTSLGVSRSSHWRAGAFID